VGRGLVPPRRYAAAGGSSSDDALIRGAAVNISSGGLLAHEDGGSPGPATTEQLTMSYQTCGYVNSYTMSDTSAAARLRGFAAQNPSGKLRIGFPGDSSNGFALVGRNDGKVAPHAGVGGTNRSGSVVVFMANVRAVTHTCPRSHARHLVAAWSLVLSRTKRRMWVSVRRIRHPAQREL
jgi:hypothetical protein